MIDMLRIYKLLIPKLTLIVFPLLFTGCIPHISVSGHSSNNPIATFTINTLVNNGYINISNQASYSLSGTCTNNGVGNVVIEEVSSTILSTANCTNGTWSTNLDFSTGFSDGTITIEALHTDAAGVVHSLVRSLEKLTVTPTIAITSPAVNAYINDANRTAFTVSGSCNVVSGSVSITGGASTVNTTCDGSIWNANLSFADNSNATPNITATLTDVANNQANSSRTFILDTVNPLISISTPASGAYVNIANQASFAISGTCSDDGTGNVVVEDASNTTMGTLDCSTGNWTASLDFSSVSYTNGPHTIEITHTDPAGNIEKVTRTFNIDKTAPNLTWSRIVDGVCVGTNNVSSFAIQGSCTDGDGNITISSTQLSSSQITTCSSGSYSTTINISTTGLNVGDTFNIQVLQADTAGNSTSVTHLLKYIASTTPTISFDGWDDVYSVGKKTYRDGNLSEPGEVSIKWKEWSAANTCQPEGVKVYRSATSLGAKTLVSEAAGVPPTTRRFSDNLTEANFNKAWYYTLQLRIAGLEYDVTTPAEISEIRVIAPPDNMALVHRWITNQEVCNLMNLTTDPANHFRCSYSGQGKVDVGGLYYHDMQHDLLVDRFELGCKISSTCGASEDTECVPPNFGSLADPSSGAGVPGAIGSVYYNSVSGSNNGMCYVKTGATSTDWIYLTYATATEVATSVTNEAHSPALGFMSRNSFQNGCAGQSISLSQVQEYPDNTANAGTINKRLLRQKEWRAAAAWSRESFPSPYTSIDEWIDYVEKSSFLSGDSLGRTGKCNTNGNKSNLTATDRDFMSNFETHDKSFETGSKIATVDCQSRYGIQDMVGNLQEMTSDEIDCPDGLSCYGLTSTLDANNTDMNGFSFDGVQAPGGSAVDSWGLEFGTYGSAYFNPVLGLPLKTNESGSIKTSTAGATFFHTDFMYLDTDNINSSGNAIGSSRFLFAGGYWSYGESGQSGRWSSVFNLDSNSWGGHMGSRCMVPVK